MTYVELKSAGSYICRLTRLSTHLAATMLQSTDKTFQQHFYLQFQASRTGLFMFFLALYFIL